MAHAAIAGLFGIEMVLTGCAGNDLAGASDT